MANSYSNYTIIRVTPTLDTNAYAQGDVLFVATEIPNAVLGNGGCSKFIGMYMLNQNLTDVDVDFIFSENSAVFGSINATADISDSTIEAANVTGFLHLDSNIGTTSAIDTAEIKRVSDIGAGDGNSQVPPILIQAAAGSTSVYVVGILTGSPTPTYAADDIDLIFHIER